MPQPPLKITPDIRAQTKYTETTRGTTLMRYFYAENLPLNSNNYPNTLLQLRALTDPNNNHIPFMFDQHPSQLGKKLLVTNVNAYPYPENSQTSAMIEVTYQDRFASQFGLPSSRSGGGQLNSKCSISSTSNQKVVSTQSAYLVTSNVVAGIQNIGLGSPICFIYYQSQDGSIKDIQPTSFNILTPGLILEYDSINYISPVDTGNKGQFPNFSFTLPPDNVLNNDQVWNLFDPYTLLLRSVTGEQIDVCNPNNAQFNNGYWWHIKTTLEYRPWPGWAEVALFSFPDGNFPPPDVDTTKVSSNQNDVFIRGNGWVGYLPYSCVSFNNILFSLGCFNPGDQQSYQN